MGSTFEDTIRAIYTRWNEKDPEGVMAAFTALGPKGFTVEYVGQPPLDGAAAVEDMWANYGGACSTDVIELLVNGHEAAALISNRIHHADGSETAIPSIETYKVSDGRLEVRYFHRTPEAAPAGA